MLATGAHLVEIENRAGLARMDINALHALMIEFAKNPKVVYVEPDRVIRHTMVPNDPRYNEQWDLFESIGGINMPAAWNSSAGTGVRVAVIDTGITPHSDLSGQIVGGYDFISDSSNARDGDGRDANPNDEGDWHTSVECASDQAASNSSWHGTHVTGTIAALTNNSVGIAGVAFGAKVVPIRVLGKCGGALSDIIDAIVWASGGSVSGVPANPYPARVINMSLSAGGACGSFQSAVDAARANGTVVVVAAGNNNRDASGNAPANCNGIIAVAATNRSGGKAVYSNFGSVVVVAASGGDGGGPAANNILSTLNSGTTTQSGETYGAMAGTSMAAPHVTALAALLLSKNPGLSPDQVRNYITTTARAFPAACSQCGAGIINADAALQAVPGPGNNNLAWLAAILALLL